MSAEETVRVLMASGQVLATAESCTGGLVAAAITSIAGSSKVFDRGFVTYSNAAKAEMLGVPPAMIAKHGAVSAQVAKAMADGALLNSRAAIAVAITGIAGPDGGTVEKPVGLVHFAVSANNLETLQHEERYGPLRREVIRAAAVETALSLVRQQLQRA